MAWIVPSAVITSPIGNRRAAVDQEMDPLRSAAAGNPDRTVQLVVRGGINIAVAHDLPQSLGEVGRVAEARLAGREIEIAALLREDGPGGVVHLVGGDELDPSAALAVVEPQLDGGDARPLGVLLPGDDVGSVGCPRRAADVGVLLGGEGTGMAAVGLHQPHVLDAAAVRGESDRGPVGREAGLRVPRGSRGQRARFASRHRHRIDVAEEIERQCLAVGRDVDRHPRSFARLELHDAGVGPRRVDVGRGVLLRSGRGRRLRRPRRGRRQPDADEHDDRQDGFFQRTSGESAEYSLQEVKGRERSAIAARTAGNGEGTADRQRTKAASGAGFTPA